MSSKNGTRQTWPFIKHPEVKVPAQELASLECTTKTEAVRQGIRGAIDCETNKLDLVAQSIALARGLRERADPNPQSIDKTFLDGIYGNL